MAVQHLTDDEVAELLPPPTRREMRLLAKELGTEEIRYLVDLYYELQGYRLAAGNQKRALTVSGEPHQVVAWAFTAVQHVEDDIRACLAAWAKEDELAVWAMGIVGIGPTLASGLRAHFDEIPPPTVGHWWSFAG